MCKPIDCKKNINFFFLSTFPLKIFTKIHFLGVKLYMTFLIRNVALLIISGFSFYEKDEILITFYFLLMKTDLYYRHSLTRKENKRHQSLRLLILCIKEKVTEISIMKIDYTFNECYIIGEQIHKMYFIKL